MNDRQIISRQTAHQQGKRRYFLGTPCKNGHIAERYVSNAACVDCVTKLFKFRMNPYTRALMPYHPLGLWIPRQLTTLQQAKMEAYIQSCIMEFCRFAKVLDVELEGALMASIDNMQHRVVKLEQDGDSDE